MSVRLERGFTIAEVLVAIVMLTVGVMALVGSSATVTRMVGRGRHDTIAAQLAMAQVERLRQIAAAGATPCGSADWKTDSVLAGPNNAIRVRWEIVDNAGNSRRARVIVRYPVARRLKVDTVVTTIYCR
jgi:Tfp pilus assembly protein PilV